MGDHWPLVVASGLIAMAAAFGLIQHEHATEVAATRSITTSRSTPLPSVSAPAQTDAPAVERAAPADVRRPLEAPAQVPVAAPAPPVKTAPMVTAPMVTAPTAPAAMAPTPVRTSKKDERAALFATLRAELQGKLAVAPMDLAGGGFAVTTEGMRLEILPAGNWSISLYNINPKTPEAETDNFKKALQSTAAVLGIDLTQKAMESANGKTYLQTICKLGNVSLVRDPANGNSCVIRPNEKWVAPPAVNVVRPEPAPVLIQQPKNVLAPSVKSPSVSPPKAPADANF